MEPHCTGLGISALHAFDWLCWGSEGEQWIQSGMRTAAPSSVEVQCKETTCGAVCNIPLGGDW